MADPTTVKRALHALAYDNADADRASDAAPRHVITVATEALAAVDDAADFCEHYRLDSLRAAIRTATARSDDELASRGREALDALTGYRRAAAGDGTTLAGPGDGHFHSGRGTSLPGAGQRGDR